MRLPNMESLFYRAYLWGRNDTNMKGFKQIRFVERLHENSITILGFNLAIVGMLQYVDEVAYYEGYVAKANELEHVEQGVYR